MSEENGKGPGVEGEVKELKELVTALRESIMELKAALSDASNPFLDTGQRPTPNHRVGGEAAQRVAPAGDERQGVEEGGERQPVEDAVASAPRVVKLEPHRQASGAEALHDEERMLVPLSASSAIRGRGEEREEPLPRGVEELARAAGALAAEERRRETAAQRGAAPVADLKRTLRILRVMYRLAQRLPGESLEHYIELLRTLGLVDDRTARTVEILKSLVEVSAREGLSPEDHIIALYSLAKMLGVEDRELEEEVAMIMVEKLKKRDREGEEAGEGGEEGEGGGSQWGLPLQ